MEVSGQLSGLRALAALLPEKEPPVPIGYEARWAPEPVWKHWSREKALDPDGSQIPAVQPVTIPTTLSRPPTFTCTTWRKCEVFLMLSQVVHTATALTFQGKRVHIILSI
jgi:hypothetical protein